MALDLTRQEAEELRRNCDFASYKTHEVRHDVAAMESLIAKGYLQKNGINVVLTPSGRELCKQL